MKTRSGSASKLGAGAALPKGNGCRNSSCDDDASLALIHGIVVDLGWSIPNPKSADE
jgi:hypothetical protein